MYVQYKEELKAVVVGLVAVKVTLESIKIPKIIAIILWAFNAEGLYSDFQSHVILWAFKFKYFRQHLDITLKWFLYELHASEN